MATFFGLRTSAAVLLPLSALVAMAGGAVGQTITTPAGADGIAGDPDGGDSASISRTETFDTSADIDFRLQTGHGGLAASGGNGGGSGDALADITINPIADSAQRSLRLWATSGVGRRGSGSGRSGGDAGDTRMVVDMLPNLDRPMGRLNVDIRANGGEPGLDGRGRVSDLAGEGGAATAEFIADEAASDFIAASVSAGSNVPNASGLAGVSKDISARGRVINTGGVDLTVSAGGRTGGEAGRSIELLEAYAESTSGESVHVTANIGDERPTRFSHSNLATGYTTGSLTLEQGVHNYGPVGSHLSRTTHDASSLSLINRPSGFDPNVSTHGVATNGSDVRVETRLRAFSAGDGRFENLSSGHTTGRLTLIQNIEATNSDRTEDFPNPVRSILRHDDRGAGARPSHVTAQTDVEASYDGTRWDHNNDAHAEVEIYAESVDITATARAGAGLGASNPYQCSRNCRVPTQPGAATISAYGRALDPQGDASVAGVATGGSAGSWHRDFEGTTVSLVNAVDGDAGGECRCARMRMAAAVRWQGPASAR